jgi:UDP-N-acetylmuramoyl-tripeptide--D-alanyl-D-alanine ligase
MRLRLDALAARCGGTVVGDDAVTVTGVAIDSRAVRPGHLFVALPGERVDGHEFVADAAGNGAAAALVGRAVDFPVPQVVVGDTLAALQRIATAERAAAAWRLAGVTGSVGKTTTKDFLAALLATTFAVGSTAGSRNSQAGFPAEVCNQPEDIAWMVAELGMSHAGELDRLGAMARPDALVYTVIAPVHIEYFASLDGIAAAKAELIPHLSPDGVLVLNLADARVAALAKRYAGRVLSYGQPLRGDLWIEAYASRGLRGSSFRLRGPGAAIAVEWTIPGRHQADNLLAAACCALALGVPPDRIGPCAAALRAARRRGEVHDLPGGVTVVDDSYNASPQAVLRLLDLLAETEGRKVAVLGEMLELGAGSVSYHRDVGERAGAVCDLVVTVGGEPAAALARAAHAVAHHVPDAATAARLVASLLRPGDVVLVKGSRGIGLDRVVDALLAEKA